MVNEGEPNVRAVTVQQAGAATRGAVQHRGRDVVFFLTQDVPAGTELLISYGKACVREGYDLGPELVQATHRELEPEIAAELKRRGLNWWSPPARE